MVSRQSLSAWVALGALVATFPVRADAQIPVPASALDVVASLRGDNVPQVTLAEAIELSNRVQPTVVQARGQIRNAESQKLATTGAWLPSLSANSSGGYSYTEGTSRIDPITNEVIGGNQESQSVSVGFAANYDLFTGFRRGADRKAANAAIDAAEAGFVNATYQQRLTTTTQYLAALFSRQLVTVREASLRRAEEQLRAAVARLRAGSATRSDSLRSLVQVGNAQVALVNSLSDLQTAEAQLARLIGVAGRVRAADDSTFYQFVSVVDTLELRRAARSAAPQVLSAEASREQAKAQLSASKSAYWPTLALNGSWNYSGSDRNDFQLFNNRQVSLGLSWPIFNRFQRERTIDNQRVAFDNADALASDAVRQVDAQLSAQVGQLEATRLRIGISQTNLAAAQEDLRVQSERYRLGASTLIEVLTSQEALNQAEVDAVTARFDYLRAKAQVEALIGRAL